MAYRVLMELVPRPNEYPEEAWASENTDTVYCNPSANPRNPRISRTFYMGN